MRECRNDPISSSHVGGFAIRCLCSGLCPTFKTASSCRPEHESVRLQAQYLALSGCRQFLTITKEFSLRKIVGLTGLVAFVLIAQSATAAEMRCGWSENTMPSDLTLTDREGSWNLATIDWQTDGFDHVPSTNRGDTCGCITGVVDKKSMRIVKVLGGKLLPASTCQRDKSLK
jgi:hypothetical protein